MKREFKVTFKTGAIDIREAEAFKLGVESAVSDVEMIPYCSEILIDYFKLGRKQMLDKMDESILLNEEIRKIVCVIEEAAFYWVVAIVEVEERKVVEDIAIIECPFSGGLEIDSFYDGVVREKCALPYYEPRKGCDSFAFNCGRAAVRYVLNHVIMISCGNGTTDYEERIIKVNE